MLLPSISVRNRASLWRTISRDADDLDWTATGARAVYSLDNPLRVPDQDACARSERRGLRAHRIGSVPSFRIAR